MHVNTGARWGQRYRSWTLVLGPKLGSYGRAVSDFICWAICSATPSGLSLKINMTNKRRTWDVAGNDLELLMHLAALYWLLVCASAATPVYMVLGIKHQALCMPGSLPSELNPSPLKTKSLPIDQTGNQGPTYKASQEPHSELLFVGSLKTLLLFKLQCCNFPHRKEAVCATFKAITFGNMDLHHFQVTISCCDS